VCVCVWRKKREEMIIMMIKSKKTKSWFVYVPLDGAEGPLTHSHTQRKHTCTHSYRIAILGDDDCLHSHEIYKTCT